jgi:hypothetical protein
MMHLFVYYTLYRDCANERSCSVGIIRKQQVDIRAAVFYYDLRNTKNLKNIFHIELFPDLCIIIR